MANELIDEIITLIHSEANNNPPPQFCTIVGNYDGESYTDVEVESMGRLYHKKTIGTTDIGSEAIICFLNGNLDDVVVIAPPSNKNDVSFNLDNIEVDIDLSYGISGREDIITVETFLKEK